MWKLLKELLSVLVLKMRHETLTQCCYAAVAYAVEQRAKREMTDSEFRALQVWYLEKVLPGIKDAEMHLDSMQSRLVGVGANPSTKL